MKWIRPYGCLILLLGLSSCLEEIDPRSLEFEDLLVIEGLITDEIKNHEILITRTFELDQNEIRNESGATVWVEDIQGQRVNFIETEPGRYVSSTAFGEELGREYRLNVQTSNGSNYESSIVELLPVPEMESVEVEFTPDQGSKEGLFDIFVTTEEPGFDFVALRWIWSETYIVKVPHPSTMFWDGRELIRRIPPRQLESCFATNFSNTVILNSVVSENGKIIRQLVHSFDSRTQRVANRYSIEVSQYALNANSFNFWNLVRRNSEDQGGLFDEQPGTIVGNMTSTDNTNERVLGLFEVAQVKKTRVFYDAADFEDVGYVPTSQHIIRCGGTVTIPNRFEIPTFLRETGDRFLPWYVSSGMVEPPGIVFTLKECGDCQEHGVLEVPEFWID